MHGKFLRKWQSQAIEVRHGSRQWFESGNIGRFLFAQKHQFEFPECSLWKSNDLNECRLLPMVAKRMDIIYSFFLFLPFTYHLDFENNAPHFHTKVRKIENIVTEDPPFFRTKKISLHDHVPFDFSKGIPDFPSKGKRHCLCKWFALLSYYCHRWKIA